MSTYFFKTNINCIGCASQVKPHLDKLEESKEIEHWNVHLHTPEHLSEVVTNKMSPEQVKHYIREPVLKQNLQKRRKLNLSRWQ